MPKKKQLKKKWFGYGMWGALLYSLGLILIFINAFVTSFGVLGYILDWIDEILYFPQNYLYSTVVLETSPGGNFLSFAVQLLAIQLVITIILGFVIGAVIGIVKSKIKK